MHDPDHRRHTRRVRSASDPGQTEHPGASPGLSDPAHATLRRIIGSGDLWAVEMIFDYAGDRFYTVLIHEYRDGLVVRETSYCGGSIRGAGLARSVGRANTKLRHELIQDARG